MKNRVKFLSYSLSVSFIITTGSFWLSEKGFNKNVNTFYDVIWWWITTSFTVGYGDIIPITTVGRIAATLTIITGIYLYTNFITISAESIHQRLDRHKFGRAKVNCKNHIVICEYTAFADELIQEINNYSFLKDKPIVVVSDLVSINPYPNCHFVRGVSISPEYLQMANIQHADYIFVFSNTRFQEPDLKTLHIVSRIKKLNNHARIFVELTDPDSELSQYIQEHVVVMPSKEMLRSLLKNHTLDLESFIEASSKNTENRIQYTE